MKQYINKAAVVAEIERMLEEITNASEQDVRDRDLGAIYGAQLLVLRNLAKYLDTIKVKEVDLKKEVEAYRDTFYWDEDLYKFAKHFFELGLQVRNNTCSEVKDVVENDDSDVNTVLSELGVEPDSRYAKMLKDAFYKAVDEHLNDKK